MTKAVSPSFFPLRWTPDSCDVHPELVSLVNDPRLVMLTWNSPTSNERCHSRKTI